ncbi:MAG: hypothetical protein ACYTGK_01865 [Planctomycetota bacterium]
MSKKLARDLAVIGITAILAAPFAQPRAAHADGEEQTATPRLAAIDLDGVAVTLDGQAAKGGTPEATATLTAVNTRNAAVDRKIRVRLEVTPPANPHARMLMLPAEKWSQEIALKLAAGETKTLELRTGVRVAAREIARFRIGSNGAATLERFIRRKTAAEATKSS